MSRTTLVLLLAALAILALVAVALVLLVRFWRLRRQLAYLPDGAKWAFWGAVAYTVFPIDVLPDPIVLDDIGVLVAASAYLHRLIREREARRGHAVTSAVPPGYPARPAVEPARREA